LNLERAAALMNELTVSSNPLKLLEYLAAGLPVLSAPLPEALRFGFLVRTANTAEEYVCEIEKLLKAGIIGPNAECSAKVAGEDWEFKIEEMTRLLEAEAKRTTIALVRPR
jgi:hypothetical protein